MHQQSNAERLRLCREAFERAIADGVTVEEGRRRVALDRWAEVDLRLQRVRRCGTAPDRPRDEDGGVQLQWWQK